MIRRLAFAFVLVAFAFISAPALADGSNTSLNTPSSTPLPPEMFDVGVDEHLDAELPLDAQFQDSSGKTVRLGDLIDGKRPTVLVLAYHSCKTLCSFVQNAVLDAAKQLQWTVGKEYDIVILSIDEIDTVKIAAEKKAAMVGAYARPGSESGWHFLVGSNQNSKRVADAVGWKFHKDIDGNIAHPAAVMLLKPNGRVARYLYGIEFSPNDFRLGLLEASEGKNVTTAERILLYCYHYDAHDRKYALLATHVMQIGGGLTLLLVGFFIGGFWLRERRKAKSSPPTLPREVAEHTHRGEAADQVT